MDCTTEKMSIGSLYVQRNAIEENPVYQRESAIWSIEKMQLFLDSILNRFDVPKFYFHDLRGPGSKKKFAIVDGKQRLHTIFEFFDDRFPLASDFTLNNEEFGKIGGGVYYRDLDTTQKEILKSINLDIVLIRNAEEEDIEELFSRLNNGEPLNAAEKRNAMGGDMSLVIREVSKHAFFTKKLAFPNKRYNHFEVGAKFLLMESQNLKGGELYADLKKKFLDSLVKENRKMSAKEKKDLISKVDKRLNIVSKAFNDKDPLLKKQAYPPLYYLFVSEIEKDYAHENLYVTLHKFLNKFHQMRLENLEMAEEERDPVLLEFGRLSQQGTNDLNSLRSRVSILKRYLLQLFPSIIIKDSKRNFNYDERVAVWLKDGKICKQCKKEIPLEDMDSDHIVQWVKGGDTTIKNAQCLCISCNRKKNKNQSTKGNVQNKLAKDV